MNDQERTNRISPSIIAAVSVAVVAVTSGVAWFGSQSGNSPIPITPQSVQRVKGKDPILASTHQQITNVYWLAERGQHFILVPHPVKIAAVEPQQTLAAAFQALLAGPNESKNLIENSSNIPKGTRLLGLTLENNAIHVNLSEDFTGGGGSTSMMGRVGQVVYTATTLNPKAQVYIQVNGQPLNILGGEGVEIEQPITRKSFDKNYPL